MLHSIVQPLIVWEQNFRHKFIFRISIKKIGTDVPHRDVTVHYSSDLQTKGDLTSIAKVDCADRILTPNADHQMIINSSE